MCTERMTPRSIAHVPRKGCIGHWFSPKAAVMDVLAVPIWNDFVRTQQKIFRFTHRCRLWVASHSPDAVNCFHYVLAPYIGPGFDAEIGLQRDRLSRQQPTASGSIDRSGTLLRLSHSLHQLVRNGARAIAPCPARSPGYGSQVYRNRPGGSTSPRVDCRYMDRWYTDSR